VFTVLYLGFKMNLLHCLVYTWRWCNASYKPTRLK